MAMGALTVDKLIERLEEIRREEGGDLRVYVCEDGAAPATECVVEREVGEHASKWVEIF